MSNTIFIYAEKIFLLFLGLYSRIKIQKRLAEIMLQKGHKENK